MTVSSSVATQFRNPSFSEGRPARVVIAYFDAGGGHRAAALALQSVLSADSEWEVQLFNLQEYLDALDPSSRLFGVRIQDIYNRLLNRGSTRIMRNLLPVLHGSVRLGTPLIKRRLEMYWRDTKPDMVISVVPNLNRAIALSISSTIPATPFVTVLTDMADTPPHFWIEKESQYLICGTQRAAQQAREMGHHPGQIFQTSGMALHPKFYLGNKQDPAAARTVLGLDPYLTTVLVMFGGQGSPDMLKIASQLEGCTSPLQVIYVCGRNEVLRHELEALRYSRRRVVVGFTTDMPTYMAASDLMIGKPGPGSISEALHFGLPVVVTRNSSTMPQEVYNTHWIEERGVGMVLRDFGELGRSINALLSDNGLEAMKGLARNEKNNAIFEIPTILEHILNVAPSTAPTQGSTVTPHSPIYDFREPLPA